MKKSLAACVAFAAFGVAQATANDVPLDFLTPGKRYLAQLYQDAPDADYRTNPLVYDYRAHRHCSGSAGHGARAGRGCGNSVQSSRQ
jgi:hypothetical protein